MWKILLNEVNAVIFGSWRVWLPFVLGVGVGVLFL